MTVLLTKNFFSNARGITLLDGGGATWSINKSTNAITIAVSGGAGIGTVTSVGLASTDFTLTGTNPVTTSGSITANLAVQAGVTPASYIYASFTVNSKGVITAVSNGTQPVTSIGSTSLTLGGTTAVPTVNLSASQISNIALGGTAVQPAGLPVGASPTAKVGASVVNGIATTFMRSDAAPPIDLTANYTWTGTHAFNGHVVAVNASPLGSTVTQVQTGLANFRTTLGQATTAGLAADASMTVTCNELGWYDFEAMLLINEVTAGTGGFNFDFNGGTAVIANGHYTSQGISNGAQYANSSRALTVLSGLTPVTISTANLDWSLCKGQFQVTTAGTVALRWSQGVATPASPSQLNIGSYIKVTKIG